MDQGRVVVDLVAGMGQVRVVVDLVEKDQELEEVAETGWGLMVVAERGQGLMVAEMGQG